MGRGDMERCEVSDLRMMGHSKDISLPEPTLKEEKAADEKLTSISQAINAVAV
jgi:ferritin-like metal-binding protein YciE